MLLNERLENEVISNLITYLILKCVDQYQGVSYGYQMKKYIEKLTGKIIPEGTLYPILSKLSNRQKYGFLTSSHGEQHTKRKRRYYRLTNRGKEQLKIWPNTWSELKSFVDHILTQANKELEVLVNG